MKTETTIESPAIPPLPPATGSATVLAAKVEALEKLVIELTLIAISTATIKHHHKARLDHLLGELQYAGMDCRALDAEIVKTKIAMIELEKSESPNK